MLRVRLLGGLAVEGVDAGSLGSRKQRRLLARLALEGPAGASFDALADDLWGDDPPARPRDQLAVLVSRLRSSFEVRRTDAGYVLELGWCDVAAFHALHAESLRREGWAATAESARAALALLRGPLLPELAECDWVVTAAAELERAAAEVRRMLAEAELRVGDPRRAADLATEALAAAPYDEVALRLHMEACLVARSPALGLATFEVVRERLAEELGIDPSAETREVHQRLLAATDAPVTRTVAPAVGLPGRRAELDAVLALVDKGSGLLAVRGEPGIGKSRLLDAVAAVVPGPVLRARCDALGRVLPLQPVLDAVTSALRGRLPSEVDALLGDDAAQLAALLGGPVERGAVPDDGTGQLLLHLALSRLLERLAGDGVLVLLVDDGHLADEATAALLTALPQRASRVVTVVAARSGAGPDWPAAVELGPLDLAAVTEIVGADRAAALHARSGGHPLLLTELAEHGEDALPALTATFAAAADSAGPVGATLRAASVLGPDLDLDVLAQVLRRPAVELLDDLEEGVRRRLLVESASGFAFRHGLVREALAAGVGPTRLALLHRETARALQERPGVDPLVLAHHALAGGLHAEAVEALVRAGTIAEDRHAVADALDLADRALALDPLARGALLLRARALLVLARYAEVDEQTSLLEGPDAWQIAALAAHYRRDWPRAADLADRAAGSQAGVDRATSLAIAGHALHAMGDLEGSDQRWREAEGLARAPSGWLAILRHHQGRTEETLRLTAPGPVSTGLEAVSAPLVTMSRGLALAALGRTAEALDCFDRTEAIVDRMGLVRFRGRANNCRGYVLRNLGEHTAADEQNSLAIEAGRSIGMDEQLAHGLLDLAEGRLRRDDLAGAAALLDEASVLAQPDRPHGYQWRHRVRARWLRGRLLLAAGDLDGAGELATSVLAEATDQSLARYAAFADLLLLDVRLRQGSTVTPEEVLDVTRRMSTLAGSELPWFLSAVARDASGDVRAALDSAARRTGQDLVRQAPPELRDAVARRLTSAG